MSNIVSIVPKGLTILCAAGLALATVACGPPTPEAEAAQTGEHTNAGKVSAGNLALGEKLPDFKAPNMEGETVAVGDLLDGESYVAVIFHSPSCPCANNCATAISDMLTPEEYPDLKILGVVSDPMQDIGWFRDDLKKQMADNVTFPVVFDKDQSIMNAYGATRTPEVWLTDKDGTIRFWGAPENVLEPEGSPDEYRFLMKEALDALREGREPEVSSMAPIGCLISKMES